MQTLVCIDDESHNNEALERLLRKKYKVFTATSPLDGLELIKKHQPALIISDQRMPQMTGVELLKQSATFSPHSIRILLTGYTDLESVIAAINEGEIYRYITKPWDPNDLMITVDKGIETFNLRQEVQKQNVLLESLDRLKSEFMILVTHELRTPLAGISSFIELLKEEIKDPDQQTYIKHIQKNTERLKKLIEDILIITRLQTESFKKTSQELDPKGLFSFLWKDKGSKSLQLDISGESWNWYAPQKEAQEIFVRLIENCNLYSAPKSKVEVIIEDHSITVTNTSAKAIELDQEQLLHPFTKNEKIMNHTKGTGLGLAVVKALTEALGGQLELDIKDKRFSVTLIFPDKI